MFFSSAFRFYSVFCWTCLKVACRECVPTFVAVLDLFWLTWLVARSYGWFRLLNQNLVYSRPWTLPNGILFFLWFTNPIGSCCMLEVFPRWACVFMTMTLHRFVHFNLFLFSCVIYVCLSRCPCAVNLSRPIPYRVLQNLFRVVVPLILNEIFL